MKTKCLIIDDEELALDLLESYIIQIETLELVGKCKSAVEAYNFIQKHKIDLLFLDIQMPMLTGIEFLKNIVNQPKVIITTAYSEYAVEAFDLNVVDYLLKPISFDRFLKALNKLQPPSNALVSNISSDIQNTYDDAFIYLKEDKIMAKVLLKEILYIESLKNYVKIKTTSREIVTYKTISSMEEKLPANKFIRVHRSYIVAIDKIDAFSTAQIKIGNLEIPIGRNYKNEVFKTLANENPTDDL